MNFPTITFIGGGNMARSMIGGLVKKGCPASKLQVVEPDEATRTALNNDFGVAVYKNAESRLLQSDYVILAVKPQVLKQVCKQLGNAWSDSNALVISIAAGIRCDSIIQWLGMNHRSQAKVIRAMPNTPALIGMGATGLFSTTKLDKGIQKTIENIFSAIGISVWVDAELQLDTITALSGSGPAYFFLLLEGLIEAGVAEGLSMEHARKLVLQTAAGSAQMALNQSSDTDISVLRKRVTSKGGTTEAGLESLQQNNFIALLTQAVKVAKDRSIAISTENSD